MKKFAAVVPALVVLFALVAPELAFAQEAGAGSGRGMLGLGVGLTMGLAVLGGGLGQGNGVKAALEGISRNPQASGKITTPMILGLAFIESLVIFAFVIAFQMLGKI